jgi:hypothetical protein
MDRDRYNQKGEWKPITYPVTTDKIQAEITVATEDRREWGSLFYIRCTGQKVIEFYAIGTLDTEVEERTCTNGLRLYKCNWLTHSANDVQTFVYDGTMPLNDTSIEGVKEGLNVIESTIKNLCKSKNQLLDWDVKYGSITRGGRTIRNADGSFTVELDLFDPRNTLVVSDEQMLPTRDWKMKLEWVKFA